MKKAHYYPNKSKLTYFITDLVQVSQSGLSIDQARVILREQALGLKEVVQLLTIVPESKI